MVAYGLLAFRHRDRRVFAFLQFTTFGMVVRAGMADRETVGLLGIDIDRRFTIVFGIAAVVAGLAGVMYTPILSPDYHMGMDFLVLSFRRGGGRRHGSLGGAVLAGFLLGILQSFASMNEVKTSSRASTRSSSIWSRLSSCWSARAA